MFLASKKGLQLCDSSVREMAEEARALGKAKGFISRTCHVGFPMIVVPVIIKGRFYGIVFAGGFLIAEEAEKFDRLALYDEARAFGGSEHGFDRSYDDIPRITLPELNQLTEILEIGVAEIEAYHLEMTKRDRVITNLNNQLKERYRFDRIIGKSEPMRSMYALLDKICESDSTVLVQGDNGTGKELVAKAIHYPSRRKNKPFVIQNCAAFNDNLLESELFGHKRGAFTGAMRDKKGLFQVADGGTFFLDEIGDMSPALQVKLLRVLQEGSFTPVGGTEPVTVDVRILAATNRDLRRMVEEGTFREDLYYRVNVINIVVPPLRERRADIPMLIEHFLEKRAPEGSKPKKISKKVMRRMLEYAWPGNIRELENEIERLVVLTGDEEVITEEMLSSKLLEGVRQPANGAAKRSGSMRDAVETVEREMIFEGLRRCSWNKTRLAKELGISRANLIMKVQKYGFTKPQKAS